jgi:hypothetical protein
MVIFELPLFPSPDDITLVFADDSPIHHGGFAASQRIFEATPKAQRLKAKTGNTS